jgi:sugar lactone lactonase YvrE
MSRPTIERSHLDGSRREILIEDDLLLPNALDLDVPEQILYWADNHRNGYFRIERSFVNGTARQEVYRGIGQFIVSLTVHSHRQSEFSQHRL